jgi:hypothetical protein
MVLLEVLPITMGLLEQIEILDVVVGAVEGQAMVTVETVEFLAVVVVLLDVEVRQVLLV